MTHPTQTSPKLPSWLLERLSRTLDHPRSQKALHFLSETALPRGILHPWILFWIKHYQVNRAEAEQSPFRYPTFNAFFTRRLKPGSRPLPESPDTWVYPSDGQLTHQGEGASDALILTAKDHPYRLAELLDLPAETLQGRWSTLVTYLSPGDYHRVHAPTDATLLSSRLIPGDLLPVHAESRQRNPGLYRTNRRRVFHFDSEAGPFYLVMVGAQNIGRIDALVSEGARVSRGDEIGLFHFGSTVILIGPPTLTQVPAPHPAVVKIGQAYASPAPAESKPESEE